MVFAWKKYSGHVRIEFEGTCPNNQLSDGLSVASVFL
jgi:hypothetical protein